LNGRPTALARRGYPSGRRAGRQRRYRCSVAGNFHAGPRQSGGDQPEQL